MSTYRRKTVIQTGNTPNSHLCWIFKFQDPQPPVFQAKSKPESLGSYSNFIYSRAVQYDSHQPATWSYFNLKIKFKN